ncbi:MAG TPA: hypothetical protein VFX96_18045 [Pyrinomonadaceae bacterium]|nr:hypothetical protein [Pyrinomonadaceae bacterium]
MAVSIFKISLASLCALLLCAPLDAGTLTRAGARGALDTYGDIACEDAAARLDNFAIALQNVPEARGHIFIHGGEATPPRRIQNHVRFIKEHLTGVRGVAASRYDVVEGGRHQQLTVRLFIIPPGERPPTPFPMIEGDAADVPRGGARKFDEGFARLRRDAGGRAALATAPGCPLDLPDLAEYAKALRAESDARAYVVVYGERGARLSDSNAVSRLIRHRLFNFERIAHPRITVVYGGTRDEPFVELWVVPRGARPPAVSRR